MDERDAEPGIEVVGAMDGIAIRIDDFGVSEVEEPNRTAGRADVDRLPQAIEYQHPLLV